MVDFVSRGGEKLQFALDNFKICVKGKICADFGSSTGGFTDCLLQNGAKKVYAVDCAYGELAWKLRNSPKVIAVERTNAMHVILPQKADFITIDVGWTKQENILPSAFRNLLKGGKIVSLIKPQYEAEEKFVKKGRLSNDKVDDVLDKVKYGIEKVGGEPVSLIESPILGERGKNREFLALIQCK